MKNKKFFEAPPSSFGEYNRTGDKTMGTFYDNAKLDNFISPLDRQRMQFRNDVKVGQQQNATKGPVGQPRVTQQWKKNVYTSQPNSRKYDMIRQNIENTPKKGEDFWRLFDLDDAERTLTEPQKGPVMDKGYDSDEVDFDENDFLNNNRR
jgi:hypothetical protein